MRKIKALVLLTGVLLSGFTLQSCTDDFDEVNQNPNKLYEASPEQVFPGIAYKGVNIYSKLNHEVAQTYARYIVNWKEQNDNDNNDTYFENFYVRSLNDLEKALRSFDGRKGYENQVLMLKTWKAWEYFVLVSTFGGVPMSDATKANVTDYHKYDTELECYQSIFAMLDAAVDGFSEDGDQLTHDPLYALPNGKSDIARWKKFANSLRLYVAVTIQNLDAQLAEQQIRKCFTGGNENYLFASVGDMAVFQHGIVKNGDTSYFYDRVIKNIEAGTDTYGYTYPGMSHEFYIYLKSYNDPRLSKYADIPTETKYMPLLRQDTLTAPSTKWNSKGYRDSIVVQYRIPFIPRRGGKAQPAGYTVAVIPGSQRGETYRDPFGSVQTSSRTDGMVNPEFMKADSRMVLLSYADVCFMQAEVAIKYPGIVSGSAQSYYEAGVKASMDQYGVSVADAAAYMNQDGVKWNTNGNGLYDYRHFFKADIKGQGGDDAHLEQIYKQWYLADFFYGHQGWTLERRTRCMKFPPYFYNNSTPVGGNGICDWMSERLMYPTSERSINPEGYAEAVAALVKGSREPNMAHDGDNFYTTLGIAAPQYTNLEWWAQGHEIVYDGTWLRHPYGFTLEEVYAYHKCSTVAELRSAINYTQSVYSTYDPVTGYNVNTRTGELILPKTDEPEE